VISSGKDPFREVHFPPDLQAKLEQMARETGRPSDQVVEKVVADFFHDLAISRETLDGRFDDLESGRFKPVPGDEVFARLRAKSAARRAGNPEAADRTVDAIDALIPFPQQGHRRPDLTSRPLRFAKAGSHLIAYAPNSTPLRIIAVMHDSRSPRVMAAILRGRE
jgi:plasmid stabilization system protein ParE